MSEVEWLDEFGDNLIGLMNRARMSQRSLANATGLSEGTISKYINGQQMPGIKAVINIAYALDCSIDDLVDFCDRII